MMCSNCKELAPLMSFMQTRAEVSPFFGKDPEWTKESSHTLTT